MEIDIFPLLSTNGVHRYIHGFLINKNAEEWQEVINAQTKKKLHQISNANEYYRLSRCKWTIVEDITFKQYGQGE